jgi:hypothetical protein
MIKDKYGPQDEKEDHPEQVLPQQRYEKPFQSDIFGRKFIDKDVKLW